MTDKPMDAAAVVAAAERIVMPPVISATTFTLAFDGQRVYACGRWWIAKWSETRPGRFECSWEPDPSSPA